MASSQNIREMIGEIDKLFGDGNEDGWVDRYLKRHHWIKNNLVTVGLYYKTDLTAYTIRSFLVTEEAMLTHFGRMF